MRAIVLVMTLLLAGCFGDDAAPVGDDGGTTGYTDTEQEQLSGWIFDPAIAPITGASITIPGLGVDITSDGEGYYGVNELPVGELLVVIVQADGYLPSSKSVTLQPDSRSRLNFTLEAVPDKVATNQVLTYDGIISCQTVVREQDDRQLNDCAPEGVPNNRVWEFNVNPDTAGVVIETAWEMNSDAARDMHVVVETVNFGEFDTILAEAEGASILRTQVNEDDAARFYQDGGTIRVTVDIGRDVAGDETGVGVGAAFQQDFEIFATVFYVEGPPASYTIADA